MAFQIAGTPNFSDNGLVMAMKPPSSHKKKAKPSLRKSITLTRSKKRHAEASDDKGHVLHGLRVELRPLLDAIRFIESSNRDDCPDGDGGASIGPLQISEKYHLDAWKHKPAVPWLHCRELEHAENTVVAYWMKYCKDALEKNDWETLAKIHNGGPQGPMKEKTDYYWRKVYRHLHQLQAYSYHGIKNQASKALPAFAKLESKQKNSSLRLLTATERQKLVPVISKRKGTSRQILGEITNEASLRSRHFVKRGEKLHFRSPQRQKHGRTPIHHVQNNVHLPSVHKRHLHKSCKNRGQENNTSLKTSASYSKVFNKKVLESVQRSISDLNGQITLNSSGSPIIHLDTDHCRISLKDAFHFGYWWFPLSVREERAAIIVQSYWRMRVCRLKYNQLRWACILIQRAWQHYRHRVLWLISLHVDKELEESNTLDVHTELSDYHINLDTREYLTEKSTDQSEMHSNTNLECVAELQPLECIFSSRKNLSVKQPAEQREANSIIETEEELQPPEYNFGVPNNLESKQSVAQVLHSVEELESESISSTDNSIQDESVINLECNAWDMLYSGTLSPKKEDELLTELVSLLPLNDESCIIDRGTTIGQADHDSFVFPQMQTYVDFVTPKMGSISYSYRKANTHKDEKINRQVYDETIISSKSLFMAEVPVSFPIIDSPFSPKMEDELLSDFLDLIDVPHHAKECLDPLVSQFEEAANIGPVGGELDLGVPIKRLNFDKDDVGDSNLHMPPTTYENSGQTKNVHAFSVYSVPRLDDHENSEETYQSAETDSVMASFSEWQSLPLTQGKHSNNELLTSLASLDAGLGVYSSGSGTNACSTMSSSAELTSFETVSSSMASHETGCSKVSSISSSELPSDFLLETPTNSNYAKALFCCESVMLQKLWSAMGIGTKSIALDPKKCTMSSSYSASASSTIAKRSLSKSRSTKVSHDSTSSSTCSCQNGCCSSNCNQELRSVERLCKHWEEGDVDLLTRSLRFTDICLKKSFQHDELQRKLNNKPMQVPDIQILGRDLRQQEMDQELIKQQRDKIYVNIGAQATKEERHQLYSRWRIRRAGGSRLKKLVYDLLWKDSNRCHESADIVFQYL